VQAGEGPFPAALFRLDALGQQAALDGKTNDGLRWRFARRG